MSTFYCRQHTGDPDFNIDEWNRALEYCDKLNIQGLEREKILHPELHVCKQQCFDCMADVGDRRKKTSKLLNP